MSSYYVRIKPQLDGTNAVHKEDCPFFPNLENRIYLGEFNSCSEALREAKLFFSKVSGCYFCSREILHTKNKNIHNWLQKQDGLITFDKSDYN